MSNMKKETMIEVFSQGGPARGVMVGTEPGGDWGHGIADQIVQHFTEAVQNEKIVSDLREQIVILQERLDAESVFDDMRDTDTNDNEATVIIHSECKLADMLDDCFNAGMDGLTVFRNNETKEFQVSTRSESSNNSWSVNKHSDCPTAVNTGLTGFIERGIPND